MPSPTTLFGAALRNVKPINIPVSILIRNKGCETKSKPHLPLQKNEWNKQPAALYFLSRRFMTEPKITANRRVVVIGSSSTAIACLEGLVFTPYLNLTSLTLVSPNGIPSPIAVGSSDTVGRPSLDTGSGGESVDGVTIGGEPINLAAGRESLGGGPGEVRLSPCDEDKPDADQMAKMGLERHVRIVRSGKKETCSRRLHVARYRRRIYGCCFFCASQKLPAVHQVETSISYFLLEK